MSASERGFAPGTPLTSLARGILAAARLHGARIATAESCTGGLVASLLTDIAGASDVVWGGLVTYQTSAKRELLGVSTAILEAHGEVSAETARAMAEGALARLPAGPGYAVSTTGNAGPTGEPVGRVWIGIAVRESKTSALDDGTPPTQGPVITEAVRHEFDPSLGRERLKAVFAHAALEFLAQTVRTARS